MPVNPLNYLEEPEKPAKINQLLILLAKPALTLISFIVFGYFTMWMSLNYVRQDKFLEYIKQQTAENQLQDKTATERFNVVQLKLETIINQQVSYTEQLKAYNQIMLNIQRQVDSLDDRVKYIERRDSK
jgi:DNA/RNA endonuclease YhcR with UshA esterase domain